MKKTILTMVIVSAVALYSCKKDKKGETEPAPNPLITTAVDNYSSLDDFYTKNKVKKQTYTINASSGGSFVTPNATTVNIPANAFAVAGNVTIEFKDIYKKSDMLMSNMATQQMFFSSPLKSAGEFFIKALNSNNLAVALTASTAINILQPFLQAPDTGMKAFIAGVDTSGNDLSWYNSPGNTVLTNATNYVFSLYQFNSPLDSGTWCNSDNAGFFAAYPQTVLSIQTTQTGFNPDVFLVFKNVNSMIHVYQLYPYNGTNFPYQYAPVGFECTVVAIGVKDGKLHSSFIPITISANQTVNFNLTETTTENFKIALKALD